ncbi:MAG: hypothetical protein AB7T06_35565 [Kofleriaceae bacterium]
MRRLLLLALAACGSNPRALPDSAIEDSAPAPDADEDIYNRVVNHVLVLDDRVLWSHGQEACNLENPCANDGPGLTSLSTYSNRAFVWYEGGVGSRFVTGTNDRQFFVTGPTPDTMFVMRTGSTGDSGMSVPRRWTVGPAVDATHVYWADWSFTQTTESYTLKRTLADGDGSVVEELATVEFGQIHYETEIVHAGGYIWWSSPAGLRRVPVTGGPAEVVAPLYSTAIVATDDAIYVGARVSEPADHIEIQRVAFDGTVTPLVTDAPAHWWKPLRFMLVVEDRVWWSAEDGNIYSVPTSGGSLTTTPVGEDAGRAFVVLPDKFLVHLGFDSYRAVPR